MLWLGQSDLTPHLIKRKLLLIAAFHCVKDYARAHAHARTHARGWHQPAPPSLTQARPLVLLVEVNGRVIPTQEKHSLQLIPDLDPESREIQDPSVEGPECGTVHTDHPLACKNPNILGSSQRVQG